MRINTIPSIVAASLALIACAAARPAAAGFVTWEFVEIVGPSPAGTIGGTLSINSPPVDLTPGVFWLASTGDIVSIAIADPNLGAPGPYAPIAAGSFVDGFGPLLAGGLVHGIPSPGVFAETVIEPTGRNNSEFGGNLGAAFGDWVLVTPPAVPEPSSLVLGGIGALIGLGYWWHRRKLLAIA